jgi:hypothetical protein
MAPGEAVGRAAHAARDAVDAMRVSLGWTPRPPTGLLDTREPRFRVSDVLVGEWEAAVPRSAEAAWRDRLVRAADQIAAHRLTIFDLESHDLGGTIDWNRDPKHGRHTPLRFRRWVDYRDHSVAGDCKFVWEPNRHQHLVLLGAPIAPPVTSGTPAPWRAPVWLDACPFGRGINWRSTRAGHPAHQLGLELDLVRETGLPGEPLAHGSSVRPPAHLGDRQEVLRRLIGQQSHHR